MSSPLLRRALYVLGVLLLLAALDGFALLRVSAYQAARRDVADPLFNAAAYAGAYVLSALTLAFLYAHERRAIRWTAFAVTVVTLSVYLGFRSFNGYGFTYHEAMLVWGERAYIADALRFFVGSYVFGLAFALACVVALELATARWVPRFRSLWPCALLLVAVPMNQTLLERTVSKVYQLPVPYRVPQLVYYAYEHRVLYYGRRAEPELEPSREPLAAHLVLIMDESVGAQHLGLNGSPFDTTPLLEARRKGVFNYGIASAISNLSASSNIGLQAGLRPDQCPDRELAALKEPNLFAYMQRAGFPSFYIDAQIYSERPSNFMTRFDLDALDGVFFVRSLDVGHPEHEQDFVALDYLERIVREHERSFTYVLKLGAHLPYDDKSAPEARVFGSGDAFHSYLNALRWTVDDYLDALFRRLEATGRDVLVVYTSDHGQNLPAGDDAPRPHGTPVDPPVDEAKVPIILLAFGDAVRERVSALYDPSLVGRVSAFELFPTLLYAAGYAEEDVERSYHHTLFDAAADRGQRVFFSGNLFGIGGSFYVLNPDIGSSCFRNAFDQREQGREPTGAGPRGGME